MDLTLGLIAFEPESITLRWVNENNVEQRTRLDFIIQPDKNRKLEIYVNNVKVTEIKQDN